MSTYRYEKELPISGYRTLTFCISWEGEPVISISEDSYSPDTDLQKIDKLSPEDTKEIAQCLLLFSGIAEESKRWPKTIKAFLQAQPYLPQEYIESFWSILSTGNLLHIKEFMQRGTPSPSGITAKKKIEKFKAAFQEER